MTNAVRVHVKWKLKTDQHFWQNDFMNVFDESGRKKSPI